MATVTIPDDVMDKVVRAAREKTPQAAVLKALVEFTNRHDQSNLIPLLGTSDGFMTDEELDEMRKMD